jgi:hypothetical protein
MDHGKLPRLRQYEVADASLLCRYSSAKIARTQAIFSIFCGSHLVSGRV